MSGVGRRRPAVCRPLNTAAWCAVVVVAIVMLGKSPRRCMARPLVQGSPVHAPAVQQAHLGPRSQAQWTEPARCPTWHLAGPNAPVPWMGRWPARSSSMLLPHLVGQVPGTPRSCGSVSRCKTWWLLGRPGGQDWPTSEDNGRHAPWHIESAEKIKQSKRLARNQTIKIPQIPLSHPTGFQNQNNQNPGKIPVNGKH